MVKIWEGQLDINLIYKKLVIAGFTLQRTLVANECLLLFTGRYALNSPFWYAMIKENQIHI